MAALRYAEIYYISLVTCFTLSFSRCRPFPTSYKTLIRQIIHLSVKNDYRNQTFIYIIAMCVSKNF